METPEHILLRAKAAVPEAHLEIIPNPTVPSQPSLLLDRDHAVDVARFLRDDTDLQFDFASNVTGVDWPERIVKEKRKVSRATDGAVKEIEETIEHKTTPYLEAVYHLYSVSRKSGPLIIRMRTGNRTTDTQLPSLTPVWRACEFQEREIFDLYGITFAGHPDLRRLLMWEDFEGHPMRKDYAALEKEGGPA